MALGCSNSIYRKPMARGNAMSPLENMSAQTYMARCTITDTLFPTASTSNEFATSFWLRFVGDHKHASSGAVTYFTWIYTGDSAGINHEYIRFLFHVTDHSRTWIQMQLVRYNGSSNVTNLNVHGSPVILDGQWHHFGFQFDMGAGPLSGQMQAYMDGALIGTNTFASGAFSMFSGQICVGNLPLASNTPSTTTANGACEMADWAMWDAVLPNGSFQRMANGEPADWVNSADLHFHWYDFTTTPQIGPASWTQNHSVAPGPTRRIPIYTTADDGGGGGGGGTPTFPFRRRQPRPRITDWWGDQVHVTTPYSVGGWH